MAAYHTHRRQASYGYPETYSSPIKSSMYSDYNRYYGASSPPASSSPIASSLPLTSPPYSPVRQGRGHARVHSSPGYAFDARPRFVAEQDAYTLPPPKRTHVPALPDARKAVPRLSLPPRAPSAAPPARGWRLPSFRESFPDADQEGTLPGPPEFHFDDLEDACEPPAHPRDHDDVMRATSVPESRFDTDESAVEEADEEVLDDDDEDDGIAVVVSPAGNRRFSTSSEREHYTPTRVRIGSFFATPKREDDMSMVTALLDLRRSLFAPAPSPTTNTAPTTAPTFEKPSPSLAAPSVQRTLSETDSLASCPPLSGPSSASTERSGFRFASTPFDGETTVHVETSDDKLPPSSAPVSPVLETMEVEKESSEGAQATHNSEPAVPHPALSPSPPELTAPTSASSNSNTCSPSSEIEGSAIQSASRPVSRGPSPSAPSGPSLQGTLHAPSRPFTPVPNAHLYTSAQPASLAPPIQSPDQEQDLSLDVPIAEDADMSEPTTAQTVQDAPMTEDAPESAIEVDVRAPTVEPKAEAEDVVMDLDDLPSSSPLSSPGSSRAASPVATTAVVVVMEVEATAVEQVTDEAKTPQPATEVPPAVSLGVISPAPALPREPSLIRRTASPSTSVQRTASPALPVSRAASPPTARRTASPALPRASPTPSTSSVVNHDAAKVSHKRKETPERGQRAAREPARKKRKSIGSAADTTEGQHPKVKREKTEERIVAERPRKARSKARKHIVIHDEDDDLEAEFRAAAAAATSAPHSRKASKARGSSRASSSSLSPPPELVFDSDTSPPTSSPPDSASSSAGPTSSPTAAPTAEAASSNPTKTDLDAAPEPTKAESNVPPYTNAALVGLLIETLAQSRASAMSPSALYRDAVCRRAELKSERPKKEWLHVIADALEEGRQRGVFGCVERDAEESKRDRHLEDRWFYVPEADDDRERAEVLRAMMPTRRSETRKWKRYYWKPLEKMSRWDAEDAI